MLKIKEKRLIIFSLILIAEIIFIITYIMQDIVLFSFPLSDDNTYVARLKDYIFSETVSNSIKEEISENTGKTDSFTVFISICSKKDKASVASGTGNTLEDAWEKADKEAYSLVKINSIDVKWVKADIINNYREIETEVLGKVLEDCGYDNYFRGGISFDPDFKNAFLESELNSNNILDYDSIETPIKSFALRSYTDDYRYRIKINEIPKKIMVFTTIGYYCGTEDILNPDSEILELYTDGRNTGRRKISVAEGDYINKIMINTAEYLHGLIGEDGQFVYGYQASLNKELSGYNILRHAGSIWSLINLYNITRDEGLLPKIDAAISFLENNISYTDKDTAFVIDKYAGEVKLGGNGLAIIMLTEYMDVMENEKHLELVEKLANGIIQLQNEDGSYFHVLNSNDFSPKFEFRTIYYDGEATFALTRAYTFTKDEKYLNAAKNAVEYFISNDYTQYRDHWVAYSMNEITQYIDDVRYYEFALKNASNNFNRIKNSMILHPTNLELLMGVWRTYERAQERGISSEFIKNFDMESLSETIYTLAQRQLNGYFYPEYAMYTGNPEKYAHSFYIRNDAFRIRIDDIQHFFGGNYFYVLYYDKIKQYLSDDFLTEINFEEKLFDIIDNVSFK